MEAGAPSHEGALGNLGEGGIFIHAPAPYPAGTRLALRFRLRSPEGGRTLRARGEVVWVRRAGGARLAGFGVRFTEIDPADAGVIARLLGRLQEDRRALGFA